MAKGESPDSRISTVAGIPFMYEKDCCVASEFCSVRFDQRKSEYEKIEQVWGGPVVISPRSFVTHSLGNGLIAYYVLRGLAHEAMQDFVYPYTKKDLLYGTSEFFPIENTFFDFMPTVVQSQHRTAAARPLSRSACFETCSARNGRIWPEILYSEYVTQSIKKEIPSAVIDYYKSLGEAEKLDKLMNEVDACVHYRTGDILKYPNVGMMNDRYPLLKFRFVASYIPRRTKSIIIVSNDPARGSGARGKGSIETKRSIQILNGLVEYLSREFPKANVSLSVDASLTEDLARLIFAKTTVCSSSTFCYFPAIAAKGRVFTPVAAVDEFPLKTPLHSIIPSAAFVRLSEVMKSTDPIGVLSR